MSGRIRLVLASGSPRRLQLLGQIGVTPDRIMPVDIDEGPKKSELPRNLVRRLAREKAEAALARLRAEPAGADTLILAADTVVAVGRRALPKADLIEEATACLRLLSGRSHRVYTALALATVKGAIRQRLIEARVRFKRLSQEDIESYLASGEWRGKAGGYAVQGLAGAFVVKLVGSYTSIVGLPLYETMTLLNGEGYPIHFGWLNPA
jgi:septum formation protein